MIPHAKQFIAKKQEEHFKRLGTYADTNSKIGEWMIEFTELHVTQALKQASEKHDSKLYMKGLYKGAKWIELKEGMEYNPLEKSIMTKTDKKSILKAYPLNNIK